MYLEHYLDSKLYMIFLMFEQISTRIAILLLTIYCAVADLRTIVLEDHIFVTVF